jgi:hypothetical protein
MCALSRPARTTPAPPPAGCHDRRPRLCNVRPAGGGLPPNRNTAREDHVESFHEAGVPKIRPAAGHEPTRSPAGTEVCAGGVQPAVDEPVDPFEGGDLDVVVSAPGAVLVDQLGLEQPDLGLGECVVVGVAHAADTGRCAGFGQPLGEPDGGVLVVHSVPLLTRPMWHVSGTAGKRRRLSVAAMGFSLSDGRGRVRPRQPRCPSTLRQRMSGR